MRNSGTMTTDVNRDSAPSREVAALPEWLDKRLAAYALTAGVAGVGILATTSPARADIIHGQINGGVHDSGFLYDEVLSLDLNHDGVTDFVLFATARTSTSGTFGRAGFFAAGSGRNGTLGGATGPLGAGALIGPSQKFGGGATMASQSRTWDHYRCPFRTNVHHTGISCTSSRGGPWRNSGGFLGLKFDIKGQTHYGWIELSISAGGGAFVSGYVADYAYQSQPNVPITAGATATAVAEPGSLSLLALGALGLAAWRRKRQGAGSTDREIVGEEVKDSTP
jgi:hypothetical protein